MFYQRRLKHVIYSPKREIRPNFLLKAVRRGHLFSNRGSMYVLWRLASPQSPFLVGCFTTFRRGFRSCRSTLEAVRTRGWLCKLPGSTFWDDACSYSCLTPHVIGVQVLITGAMMKEACRLVIPYKTYILWIIANRVLLALSLPLGLASSARLSQKVLKISLR